MSGVKPRNFRKALAVVAASFVESSFWKDPCHLQKGELQYPRKGTKARVNIIPPLAYGLIVDR